MPGCARPLDPAGGAALDGAEFDDEPLLEQAASAHTPAAVTIAIRIMATPQSLTHQHGTGERPVHARAIASS
jgi:hypothetical protein